MTRAGMTGAPASMLVSPQEVARRILLAIHARPRVVNVAPWQTAFVALAETLPAAHRRDSRAESGAGRDRRGPDRLRRRPLPPRCRPQPTGRAAAGRAPDFDDALEPLRRRMERVKLSPDFVRDLLCRRGRARSERGRDALGRHAEQERACGDRRGARRARRGRIPDGGRRGFRVRARSRLAADALRYRPRSARIACTSFASCATYSAHTATTLAPATASNASARPDGIRSSHAHLASRARTPTRAHSRTGYMYIGFIAPSLPIPCS